MDAFNDAIHKLLWPETRLDKASIMRTSQECQLQIEGDYIPEPLHALLRPAFDSDGYFRIGHIPAGMPINLLANINPEGDPKDLADLCLHIKAALLQIDVGHLDAGAADDLLKKEVAPLLWKVNKCPDFVEDRGHYYGTGLPDPDKQALIEYLKTL